MPQEPDIREETRKEMTEQDAERVMRHWLKKSGFERWELYKGCILFRKRGCPPVHLMTWDNVKFYYPADEIMFKKEHVTCREVVQRCLDTCMKGLYVYVIDSKQIENIDLLKPFQSLEELMVEIDLSCGAEDVLTARS